MLEPEKLLRELGETLPGSGGDDARTATAGTPERFCNGCWAALPVDATACPDCGRSLAEIEAARQARLAADHNWIPPRRKEAGETAAASAAPAFSTPDASPVETPVIGPAVPDPLAQELRKSRHHFLMAVLIGSAWGGAVMVAAWFTITNMDSGHKPPANPPAISAAAVNTPVANSEANPEVKVHTKSHSRIIWVNPYSEIRLELYSTADNLRVARQGDEIDLTPGVYLVRIKARDAGWHIPGGTVTAEAGAPLRVAVSPRQAGKFFLDLGDRYHGTDKLDRAIRSWQLAVAANPKLTAAHMRLASTLALKNRNREARQHLDMVLAAEPQNAEALEIKRILDELDQLP